MSETYVISLQGSVENLTTIVKELKRDLKKADEPYEAVEPLFIISGITQLKEIHTNWEAVDPGYALLKKDFQQRKWTSIVSINIYIFLFSDYKDILSL